MSALASPAPSMTHRRSFRLWKWTLMTMTFLLTISPVWGTLSSRGTVLREGNRLCSPVKRFAWSAMEPSFIMTIACRRFRSAYSPLSLLCDWFVLINAFLSYYEKHIFSDLRCGIKFKSFRFHPSAWMSVLVIGGCGLLGEQIFEQLTKVSIFLNSFTRERKEQEMRCEDPLLCPETFPKGRKECLHFRQRPFLPPSLLSSLSLFLRRRERYSNS